MKISISDHRDLPKAGFMIGCHIIVAIFLVVNLWWVEV